MKDLVKDDLGNYTDTFIQRLPRYAIKSIGSKKWISKNKPLSDIPIISHIQQKYIVGVLGKWYPSFGILDFDDTDKSRIEEIRDSLNFNSDNSMLFTSESQDSYHLLFRPSYNKKPPTINLLNEILKPCSKQYDFEIYPQPRKAIRLPFGYNQKPIDFEYITLSDWKEYLYWFKKLDYYDLKKIPYQQLILDTEALPNRITLSTYQEGKYLYENGLIMPNSRHESQWKVIYYLWRQNIPLETNKDLTFNWINKKHNGFSKDILTNPQQVKKEIERQANRVYFNYQRSEVYPDSTHNDYRGFITKDDINEIVLLTKARLPKTKFTFNLIKYCYPRRYQTFIDLHRDKLIKWGSRETYLKNLKELSELGILNRYNKYSPGVFSKSIKINWKWKDTNKAILVDYRSPEDFESTIKAVYSPEEFRELLIRAGSEYNTAIQLTRRVFKKVTK